MSDIIAAVSTGNQVCAIGIIRMTGPGCAQVANQVFTTQSGKGIEDRPRMLVLGKLHDRAGRCIDQCMGVFLPGPGSYTGEDTVELHCHGSPAVLSAGLDALFAKGARCAQRGEFTKRAFLNGRLDLTQAEAVIDLIEAETADAAANAAAQVGGALREKLEPIYSELTDLCAHFHAVLDYPDEDIDDFSLVSYSNTLHSAASRLERLLASYGQGRILRQGVRTAIVGRPNVGKSSLLNALLGYDRAIVTDIPGTTRDTVEESAIVGSVRLRLTDTAGIRDTQDVIEAMGVERSRAALRSADLAIFVCDGSRELTEEDEEILELCRQVPNVIALVNKTDLGQQVQPWEVACEWVIPVSIRENRGLDQLRDVIQELFADGAPCDGSLLTNPRQFDAIARSFDALQRALQALHLGLTADAVLTDVEIAMDALGEVTGGTVRQDITARIFERFCVGK